MSLVLGVHLFVHIGSKFRKRLFSHTVHGCERASFASVRFPPKSHRSNLDLALVVGSLALLPRDSQLAAEKEEKHKWNGMYEWHIVVPGWQI